MSCLLALRPFWNADARLLWEPQASSDLGAPVLRNALLPGCLFSIPLPKPPLHTCPLFVLTFLLTTLTLFPISKAMNYASNSCYTAKIHLPADSSPKPTGYCCFWVPSPRSLAASSPSYFHFVSNIWVASYMHPDALYFHLTIEGTMFCFVLFCFLTASLNFC